MKKLILLLLLSCFIKTKSQINHVANPGFELPLTGENCGAPANSKHNTVFNFWVPNFPWQIPDEGGWCTQQFPTGSTDLYCNNGLGHNGSNRYIHIQDPPEYLEQNITPLIYSHIYYVEYWVQYNQQSAPTSFNGGVKFYMKRPKQCSRYLLGPQPWNPDVGVPSSYYVFDHNWHKVSGFYRAVDNFPYMVIGDIRHGGHASNFHVSPFDMLWDDFLVVDVGSEWCVADNFIQNITFQNVNGIIYRSQTLTEAGHNVTSGPVGDVIVTNTADVNFQSATQVALAPGFSVQKGGIFHAYIAPCNNNCPTISAYVGGEEEYCSMAGQTVQLGEGGSSNNLATYQWSATKNGVSDNSLLSSTTIADPILTIPSGAGYLVISVTVINSCDGTSTTDEQLIYYDDNPVVNPVIYAAPATIQLASSNPYPSFTITGDVHTQNVSVIMFDASGNQINQWDEDDFPISHPGPSYQWNFSTYPTSYDHCQNYSFQVTSKNICSNNSSPAAVVNVQGGSTGIGPATGPLGFCQPNQSWCINAAGIHYFDINIKDRYGSDVFIGNGYPNQADPFCVWSGQCNQCIFGNHLNDGTYYYFLTLRNDCGFTGPTMAGPLQLTSGNCRMSNQNDTLAIEKDTSITVSIPHIKLVPNDTLMNYLTATNIITQTKLGNNITLSIFPNPTTGVVNINLRAQYAGNLLVNVSEANSKQLMHNSYRAVEGDNSFKLDLSTLNSGVYFINITDGNGVTLKNDKIMLMGQ